MARLARITAAGAVLVTASAVAASAVTYDQRKATVLFERKAVRSAVEAAYEKCLTRRQPAARCGVEAEKAGEKALANWRAAGNNPHGFTTY